MPVGYLVFILWAIAGAIRVFDSMSGSNEHSVTEMVSWLAIEFVIGATVWGALRSCS
jgi:hypothetical protein